MKKMLKEVRNCNGITNEYFNKDMIMTEADRKDFNTAGKCHICNKKYSEKDIRGDHSHVTGNYIGSAHQDRNINYRITDKIPVIFHNLRIYDSHLIMQQIDKIAKKRSYKNKKGEVKEMNINLISNDMEKYMAFKLGNDLVSLIAFGL